LHNEKLNDLHCSPDTIWVIKQTEGDMGRGFDTYGGEKRSM